MRARSADLTSKALRSSSRSGSLLSFLSDNLANCKRDTLDAPRLSNSEKNVIQHYVCPLSFLSLPSSSRANSAYVQYCPNALNIAPKWRQLTSPSSSVSNHRKHSSTSHWRRTTNDVNFTLWPGFSGFLPLLEY